MNISRRLRLTLASLSIISTGVALVQCVFLPNIFVKLAMASFSYYWLKRACRRFWLAYNTTGAEWRRR